MKLTCRKCKSPVTMVEGHITDLGWVCDTCYYQDQPWEEKEANEQPGTEEEPRDGYREGSDEQEGAGCY